MAAEEVAQALMAMDDPDVRRRVGQGDFAALESLDLTPEEQSIVSDATPVLPDGHPSKQLVAFEAGDVEAHSLTPGEDSGYWPAGTSRAISYVQAGLEDPKLQARFRGWQRQRADEVP